MIIIDITSATIIAGVGGGQVEGPSDGNARVWTSELLEKAVSNAVAGVHGLAGAKAPVGSHWNTKGTAYEDGASDGQCNTVQPLAFSS